MDENARNIQNLMRMPAATRLAHVQTYIKAIVLSSAHAHRRLVGSETYLPKRIGA